MLPSNLAGVSLQHRYSPAPTNKNTWNEQFRKRLTFDDQNKAICSKITLFTLPGINRNTILMSGL